MQPAAVTAVILTRNAEKTLQKTLESVAFCSEILIIDDCSSDTTCDIAQTYKQVRICTRPLKNNFAAQRNFGLSEASFDWVLFVDSDEVVTSRLREEILGAVSEHRTPVAYWIRRIDFFWNTRVAHGEVHGAAHRGFLRLMKKNSGTWEGAVHEMFCTAEKTAALTAYLHHYPHPTLAEFIAEVNTYSTMRAQELFHEHYSLKLWELVVNPFGKFAYTYVLLGGWKDGMAGFCYSFLLSFHSFLVRAKLYQYIHFPHEEKTAGAYSR